ncbi:hypothetical protein BD414DRAFT_418663, partial [Trametes punicea]
CTRWYLPLLLLPFPIAPPFYLLLWIFSMCLHARPCFYCMALLSTMYISLCYWPPVPIDTPLVRPWSANVTTFADALRYKMPGLPPEKMPDMMPLEEHCWCDLSSGVFSPINMTKWEEASVNRVVENLERDLAAEKEAARRQQCEETDAARNSNGTSCADEPLSVAPRKRRRRRFPILNLLNLLGLAPSSANTPTNASDATATPTAQKANTSDSFPSRNSPQQTSIGLPWIRREYDLRRFGFAMVLDFGWPGSDSQS